MGAGLRREELWSRRKEGAVDEGGARGGADAEKPAIR